MHQPTYNSLYSNTKYTSYRNNQRYITEEELKTQLRTQEGYSVIQVHRFSRKVLTENGTYSYVPTQTVKIWFAAQVLPQSVYIYWTTAPVEKYVPPIQQCNNCYKFGHWTKYCQIRKNVGNVPSTKNMKNCSHATSSKCPVFHLQRKIRNLMVENNISFHQTREIHRGNLTFADVIRNKQQIFPITQTPQLKPTTIHECREWYTNLTKEEETK